VPPEAAVIHLEEVNVPKQLRIAKDLALPLDAVTQTLAFIARKGGGKTYGAQLLAEQMLDAGAQVVAIDPVGNWFSLRLGADGRPAGGKDIYVFGGEHGDLPLTPEAGPRIAQLVVEKRASVVLDVSGFRKGERKRFAAAFAEELFHRKKAQRSPMHLFLEEAQKLVPQVPEADERQMLGAFEDIVRLGRNYGIGCTMITQRPQSVNKEVLSQTECLVVLQVNGEHERKALEGWVKEANADRKLVGELPGLAVGEAYLWSPSWLRTFSRIHLGRKTTFDASATPQVGRAAAAAGKLTPMDVAALRSDLAEVVASAEKDDPKALRRRIVELERELAKKPAAAAPAPAKEKRVEVPVLKDAQVDRLVKLVERAEGIASRLTMSAAELRHEIERAARPGEPPPAPRPAAPFVPFPRSAAAVAPPTRRPIPAPIPARAAPERLAEGAGDAAVGNSGLRRMLIALAQRPQGLTNAQLGVRAGVSSRSGTFSTYLGRARSQGWVDGRGHLKITDAGLAALGAYDPLPEGMALAEYWIHELGGGAARMLRTLVEAYPNALTNEQLGQAAQISHVSGTFSTYLGRLRALELVEGRGELRASAEFFTGGA
jgi:hypothetical protein